MKKLIYITLILSIIFFSRISPDVVFKAYAANEEQKYDSMQWYFKARYLYEQRKDSAAAKKAIMKACELDFDNAEAFAYMYILADRLKFAVPENFILKIPEYMGSSGNARRWHINGVDAFGRRDFTGALFCFEQAAKDDVTNDQISYMINASKREMMLAKLRGKNRGPVWYYRQTAQQIRLKRKRTPRRNGRKAAGRDYCKR